MGLAQGFKTLDQDYAGKDSEGTSSQFGELSSLKNPYLHVWSGYFYGNLVISDPIMDYKTKSAAFITIQSVANDMSSTHTLHKEALLNSGGTEKSVTAYQNLGKTIREAQTANDITAMKTPLQKNKEFYLAAISGLAATGNPNKTNPEETILYDLLSTAKKTGITIEEMEYAIAITVAERGFPVALEAGRMFQKFLVDNKLGVPKNRYNEKAEEDAGFDVFDDYAGNEVGTKFLNGFAPYSPLLALLTLKFPYRLVTAKGRGPFEYGELSTIKVTMLKTNDDAPNALELHSNSLMRNNDFGDDTKNKDLRDSYWNLADSLKSAKNSDEVIKLIEEKEKNWARGEKKFYLPAIAGLAALGEDKKDILEGVITKALQTGIELNKVQYAMAMASVYRGFPYAIAGTESLTNVLQKNPALHNTQKTAIKPQDHNMA